MKRETHMIDAENRIAGRLASEVAKLLQGKNKVEYQPHTDCGDNVQISNVGSMRFTGKKLENKIYYRSTGYPGGIRTKRLSERLAERPEDLFRSMVLTMLPKNKLRDNMIKRLTFVTISKS